jgi:hypothetical protein
MSKMLTRQHEFIKHKINGKFLWTRIQDAENAGYDLAFFSVVASSPNFSTIISAQR